MDDLSGAELGEMPRPLFAVVNQDMQGFNRLCHRLRCLCLPWSFCLGVAAALTSKQAFVNKFIKRRLNRGNGGMSPGGKRNRRGARRCWRWVFVEDCHDG